MKTKFIFISLFIIQMFLGCSLKSKVIKNISCKGNLNIQYDKNKTNNSYPLADKKLKAFTVYFLNNFKDSIHAYVNNKLYFNKYLNLNGDSDDLKNYFGYSYLKDSNIPILKIESKSRNSCFDIEINKKYKLIYVFLSEDGIWTVRFSNKYYGR